MYYARQILDVTAEHSNFNSPLGANRSELKGDLGGYVGYGFK